MGTMQESHNRGITAPQVQTHEGGISSLFYEGQFMPNSLLRRGSEVPFLLQGAGPVQDIAYSECPAEVNWLKRTVSKSAFRHA